MLHAPACALLVHKVLGGGKVQGVTGPAFRFSCDGTAAGSSQ